MWALVRRQGITIHIHLHEPFSARLIFFVSTLELSSVHVSSCPVDLTPYRMSSRPSSPLPYLGRDCRNVAFIIHRRSMKRKEEEDRSCCFQHHCRFCPFFLAVDVLGLVFFVFALTCFLSGSKISGGRAAEAKLNLHSRLNYRTLHLTALGGIWGFQQFPLMHH